MTGQKFSSSIRLEVVHVWTCHFFSAPLFSPKQHCPIILGCISPRVPVSYGPLVATEAPGHSPELIKGFATLLRLCRELGRVLKDRHFTDVYACTLLCPRSRFLPLKFFFPIFDDDPFKPPNLDQPCLFLARNSRLLRKQISRFFQQSCILLSFDTPLISYDTKHLYFFIFLKVMNFLQCDIFIIW